MPDVPTPHAEIAQAIRLYLRANPSAADTVVGVRTWWLPRDWPIEAVQAGLDALLAQGILGRRALPDGDWIYSARWPWPGDSANS